MWDRNKMVAAIMSLGYVLKINKYRRLLKKSDLLTFYQSIDSNTDSQAQQMAL